MANKFANDYIIPEEHKKILDERIAQYESGQSEMVTLEEIKKKLHLQNKTPTASSPHNTVG